jgi:hypothetical protein
MVPPDYLMYFMTMAAVGATLLGFQHFYPPKSPLRIRQGDFL